MERHEQWRTIKEDDGAGDIQPSPIQFIRQSHCIAHHGNAGNSQQVQCQALVFKKRGERSNKKERAKLHTITAKIRIVGSLSKKIAISAGFQSLGEAKFTMARDRRGVIIILL